MTQTYPATGPTFAPSATVNEILAQCPAAVSVFNAFGIDACCGGDAPLDEAARRDGVDLNTLVAALEGLGRTARDAQ